LRDVRKKKDIEQFIAYHQKKQDVMTPKVEIDERPQRMAPINTHTPTR